MPAPRAAAARAASLVLLVQREAAERGRCLHVQLDDERVRIAQPRPHVLVHEVVAHGHE